MITCYIIDDEPSTVEAIKRYAIKSQIFDIVGYSYNPIQALDYLKSNSVDIVFADIDMEEMTGIELIKLSRNKVVFITAHEKYALQAFDVSVIDFLVKPIDYYRFSIAVNKIKDQFPEVAVPDSFDIFSFKDQTLGKQTIRKSEVNYIEAEGYCSILHLDTVKYTISIPLKEMEAQFQDSKFARIHKSYIVNRSKVRRATFKYVELDNNIDIPIGRTYKYEL